MNLILVYITGDIHGNVYDIVNFCILNKLNNNDVFILLGDVGVNYWFSKRDTQAKKKLLKTGVTFFCIHGNHEARPSTITSYKEKEWHGGTVWYEDEYPNILFAKDGDIFDIDNKKCLVLGGAYSIDKYYRFYRGILNGVYLEDVSNFERIINLTQKIIYGSNISKVDMKLVDNCIDKFSGAQIGWWKDEQPSDAIKKYAENNINKNNNNVDFVFSHTCPAKYVPAEMFLSGINQSTVDNSTERWLDEIEYKMNYKKWYCGHWHTDKHIDNIHFLFKDIETFPY